MQGVGATAQRPIDFNDDIILIEGPVDLRRHALAESIIQRPVN
jgi:hypothetical protein